MKTIDINIWDDYYDDGYIPEGEIQKTYAYIESKLDLNEQENVLNYFLSEIRPYLNDKIKTYIELYDSSKIYKNLPEYMYFKKYNLYFENFTHFDRHELLKIIKKLDLKYNNIPLRIYSES